MGSTRVTFNRELLYQEAWSMPMTSLAKKYGLSDVGMRKICKRLQVPLPPQGYHLRKHKGAPRPLPAPSKGTPQTYTAYHCNLPAHLQDDLEKEPELPEVAFELDPANRIIVPSVLETPHPLLKATARALAKGKADETGRLNGKHRGCLNIAVYPESVDRSLLLMDTLVKALFSRGHIISIDDENRTTRLSICDETIEICLEERGKRVEYHPTLKEAKRAERLKYRTYPLYKYISSGNLSLKATAAFSSWETVFSERERTRMEDNLNKVFMRLIQFAQSVKERRLKREREERERREREEQRQEMQRRIAVEKEKLKKLDAEVDQWHKSQRIRQYVVAVRKAITDRDGRVPTGSEIESWLVWADQQADRLDPLVESPYSVLDEEHKYRHWWEV